MNIYIYIYNFGMNFFASFDPQVIKYVKCVFIFDVAKMCFLVNEVITV